MEVSTWLNLPAEKRPYPGRLNVVIGPLEGTALPDEVLHFESLQEALDELGDRDDLDEIFVIGGETLFAEAVLHPDLEEIHLTHIEGDYDCDSYFPKEIPEGFQVVSTSDILESDGVEYSFVILIRGEDEE